MVLSLPIDTQVFISTRIVDLDLYLTTFDVLGAPVHIQHGRLVLLRELIMEIVANQARFTYGCISHENHLDLLCFTTWFRCGLNLLLLLSSFLFGRLKDLLLLADSTKIDWLTPLADSGTDPADSNLTMTVYSR